MRSTLLKIDLQLFGGGGSNSGLGKGGGGGSSSGGKGEGGGEDKKSRLKTYVFEFLDPRTNKWVRKPTKARNKQAAINKAKKHRDNEGYAKVRGGTVLDEHNKRNGD